MSNDGELEQLQRDKLRAEIEQLKVSTDAQRQQIDTVPKRLSDGVLSSTLTFVAIFTGIGTFYFQSDAFLTQKNKEYEFRVTQEIITLVKQLNSENENEQMDAALLLSNFEDDAIPILLENLERTSHPDSTIESLKLVKRKLSRKNEEHALFDSLLSHAEETFLERINNPNADIQAVLSYVDCLGQLGAERMQQVLDLLVNLEASALAVESTLEDNEKERIQGRIAKARENLSGLPVQDERNGS